MGKENSVAQLTKRKEVSAFRINHTENQELLKDSMETEKNISEDGITPTIIVEEYQKCVLRLESRSSFSSTKSDPTFLMVPGSCQKKRPKSADVFRRVSDSYIFKKDHSSLRRASSDRVVKNKDPPECECTCTPRDERKCELSGSQLISFYSLWRNDKQKTLGKRHELPKFMKRRTDYRQCGCKTREYEKQCSRVKTTCPSHGI